MKARAPFKSMEGERLILANYAERLRALAVPWQETQINTRHGQTFVVSLGNRASPALVLVHGASSNAMVWGQDLVRFARAYRVHAVDVPGEPGRSSSNRLDLRGPSYGEWLADVFDGLGLPSARVIGYSQGGWIALQLACATPSRVEQLVLVGPGGVAPSRRSLLLKMLPFVLLGRCGRPTVKRILFGPRRLSPELDATMDLILRHSRPRMQTEPIFQDGALRRLTMPIVLVTGGRDSVRHMPRMLKRLKSLLPQTVRIHYPECGHLIVDFADDVLPLIIP